MAILFLIIIGSVLWVAACGVGFMILNLNGRFKKGDGLWQYIVATLVGGIVVWVLLRYMGCFEWAGVGE